VNFPRLYQPAETPRYRSGDIELQKFYVCPEVFVNTSRLVKRKALPRRAGIRNALARCHFRFQPDSAGRHTSEWVFFASCWSSVLDKFDSRNAIARRIPACPTICCQKSRETKDHRPHLSRSLQLCPGFGARRTNGWPRAIFSSAMAIFSSERRDLYALARIASRGAKIHPHTGRQMHHARFRKTFSTVRRVAASVRVTCADGRRRPERGLWVTTRQRLSRLQPQARTALAHFPPVAGASCRRSGR
jgi:hypothetical protein